MNRFLLSVLMVLCMCGVALSQWSADVSQNTVVCTGNTDRREKFIAPDGSGGALITWCEDLSNGGSRVFVQHLDGGGNAVWTADGVPVFDGTTFTEWPQVVPDANGGAIVAWSDDRNPDGYVDVYAQRVNAAGQPQWTANGVNISLTGYIGDDYPQLVSDGAGGILMGYLNPNGVFAVRVNPNGTQLWSKTLQVPGGVDLSVTSDGAGGMIAAWGAIVNDISDIVAQRIDSSGTIWWADNGLLVCGATDLQVEAKLVGDGGNGAIIEWEDFRNGTQFKAYAQHVSATGQRMWVGPSDTDGVSLCTGNWYQDPTSIAPDGKGGAFFAWTDGRGNVDDIYGQRLNAQGQVQWSDTGRAICTEATFQDHPWVAASGTGNAIVVWDDNRHNGANQDIYGQRVDTTGQIQWTTDGIPVSSAANNQNTPLLISRPDGQAIAIWDDYRNGGSGNTHPDYYAQLMSTSGSTTTDVAATGPVLPTAVTLDQNYPNPFNPSTTISYSLPSSQHVTLRIFNLLGQEVQRLVDDIQSAGVHEVHWDASAFPSGVYFCRIEAGAIVQVRTMTLAK